MYLLSLAGAAVQSMSHQRAVRVDVLHGGRAVYEIRGYVVTGEVDAQTDQAIMRKLNVTLVDPDGTLSATSVGDLLSPYDAEVQPWIGIVLPSGTVEWVPLGVFRLTNSDVDDADEGVTVKLTALDRALAYQTPLAGPVTIPAGTPVERAIRLLLQKVNGSMRYQSWVTGQVVGPLFYDSEDQAWASAAVLAESVGGSLFHDRVGVCQFAPYTAIQSGQRFSEGGTLLSVSRGEDADEIHNVVVMQSAESGTGVIRATAEDTDPDSPTYARGAYGRRQVTVTNPHLGTPAQAAQAAMARLVLELGRSETVSFDCVPDLQTDPGDVVTVNRPRAGLSERRLVVAGVTMPLDVEGVMRVTARKSILARDA